MCLYFWSKFFCIVNQEEVYPLFKHSTSIYPSIILVFCLSSTVKKFNWNKFGKKHRHWSVAERRAATHWPEEDNTLIICRSMVLPYIKISSFLYRCYKFKNSRVNKKKKLLTWVKDLLSEMTSWVNCCFFFNKARLKHYEIAADKWIKKTLPCNFHILSKLAKLVCEICPGSKRW